MADVSPLAPFSAYKGRRPYLFVSYAHADGAAVFEILEKMRSKGYRIWFDEGIDPGNEWPEDIAGRLQRASAFVVFVTPRSMGSNNVKNEINFARDRRDLPFIAIHLEETELPPGLDIRMNSLQAIMFYRLTESGFEKAIASALPKSIRRRKGEVDDKGDGYPVKRMALIGIAASLVIGGAVHLAKSKQKDGANGPSAASENERNSELALTPAVQTDRIPVLPLAWNESLRNHVDSVASGGWDSPLGRAMYGNAAHAMEERIAFSWLVGWGLTRNGMPHLLMVDREGRFSSRYISIEEARAADGEEKSYSRFGSEDFYLPKMELAELQKPELGIYLKEGIPHLKGSVVCVPFNTSVEIRDAFLQIEIPFAKGEESGTIDVAQALIGVEKIPSGKVEIDRPIGFTIGESPSLKVFFDRQIRIRMEAFTLMGNPKVYQISAKTPVMIDEASLKAFKKAMENRAES